MDWSPNYKTYWHARYELPDGTIINPGRQGNVERTNFRAQLLRQLIARTIGSLKDRTVLDLGCADGYFSRQAMHMGATSTHGIDINPEEIRKANWLKKQLREDDNITFKVGDINDRNVAPAHDVVLCLGLLYHTFNYAETLLRLRNLTRELLVVDTDVIPVSGSWAKLEFERGLAWQRDLMPVLVLTPNAIDDLASVAGFGDPRAVPVGRDAPSDYGAGRRIMRAYTLANDDAGANVRAATRRTDNFITQPFSWRYKLGTLFYKTANLFMPVANKAFDRW